MHHQTTPTAGSPGSKTTTTIPRPSTRALLGSVLALSLAATGSARAGFIIEWDPGFMPGISIDDLAPGKMAPGNNQGELIAELDPDAIQPVPGPGVATYAFVEDGTNDTLAYLELAELPATHTEVVSLTFTPAGDAIFGFGETYTGTFDQTLDAFVDDGNGFLVSSDAPSPFAAASVTDQNPPASSVIQGELIDFVIGSSDPGQPIDALVVFVNGGAEFATGSFMLVPEPASAALAAGGMALIYRRRRNPRK